MGKLSRYSGVLLSLVIIAASAVAIAKRRDITDWFILRDYSPSAEISSLAERTSMTSLGRKLFYVNDPRLLDKQGFNNNCTVSEETIVLGCFTGNNIYLYDISDPALNGVEEVTASHEMLHAVYERLSKKEKTRIDTLLERALAESDNERIKQLVQSYRERDPESVQNEMHSIIGTEMRHIPTELEDYFGEYFSNRLTVVEYSEKYEAVFIALQNQVDQLDADLLLRKAEIERIESELESKANRLKDEQAQLNQYRAENKIDEYNAAVDRYNGDASEYNVQLQFLRSIITEYNRRVEERNALSLQQNSLIKSLDSKAGEL